MNTANWTRSVCSVLLLVALLCGRSCPAAEPDPGVAVEVTADVFSKYVWRGQNVTDDWVFQPGVSASYRGATVGYWGNLDLTDENGQSGEFIEHDWYAGYSTAVTDLVGLGFGAIYYYFPGADDTTEVYWEIGLDVPASPAVTFFHDVDAVDGTYASLSLSHSLEDLWDMPFRVDLGAGLGWGSQSYNEAYWGVDTSELNDLTLTAGFPFEVAGVNVTPAVSYIALLGSDIRDAADDDDLFVAGVALAKGF